MTWYQVVTRVGSMSLNSIILHDDEWWNEIPVVNSWCLAMAPRCDGKAFSGSGNWLPFVMGCRLTFYLWLCKIAVFLQIIQAMVLLQVSAGEVVIHQGALPQDSDCMYLLASGEVDIVIAGGGGQKIQNEDRMVLHLLWLSSDPKHSVDSCVLYATTSPRFLFGDLLWAADDWR